MKRWITCCTVVVGLSIGGFACNTNPEKPLETPLKPANAPAASQTSPTTAPAPAITAPTPPLYGSTHLDPPQVDYAKAKKDVEATVKAHPRSDG
jgi:hypothetical protein